MSNNYGNESIRALKGAERIRQRPSVILGSKDIEGVKTAIFEIIANSIDEAKAGYGNEIKISYKKDGTIKISDRGRGVPMDWNEAEQDFNWRLVFCEMYAGGKLTETSDYSYSVGLNGLGSAAAQSTSEWMRVTSCRDGVKYEMQFKGGYPEGELKKEAYSGPTGTTIEFKPDIAVFDEIVVEYEHFEEVLRKQAMINAGLKFELEYEGYEKQVYDIPGGAKQVIGAEMKGKKLCQPFEFTGEMTGRDREDKDEYKVKIELAMGFCRDTNTDKEPFIELFHNSSILWRTSGITAFALEKSTTKAFKTLIKNSKKCNKGDDKITFKDIEDLMLCVVHTQCSGALVNFENQTKKAVNNPFIGAALSDFIERSISRWYQENTEEAERVLKEIVTNKKAREKADAIKASALKKMSMPADGMNNRPEKFVDCRSTNPEEKELYIVEGDSALGACKQARNADFQAIMPIRGKILNCLKADIPRIFSSDIILDLVRVIGAGVEVKSRNMKDITAFNIDNLKFDKIIICTDADIDGMQIRCLLLAFIQRLMPTLLEKGKVYIAETPLYEFEHKGPSYFAYNENEKESILKQIADGKLEIKGKYEIKRSKGLGENDPEMMSISTMHPNTRRLIAVDNAEAENIINSTFEALLGDDIESRRSMIKEYAGSFDMSIL